MDSNYIPPPAYSEQEFDQKISQATTLSLHASQASLTIDPDGFPQYDAAAFEATEGSSTSPSTAERSSPFPMETSSGKMDDYMQHGRTGDLPSVVPLRIEKKNLPKSLPKPPANFQPRDESSSLTIGENSTPTLFSSETSNHENSRTRHHSAQSTYVPYMPLSPVQHSTQIDHKRDANRSSLPPPPFESQPPESGPLLYDMPLTPVQHSRQIVHKRDTSLSPLPPPPFESQPPTRIPESGPLLYDHDNHYQQYVDPYNISPSQSARSRPRSVPQERPAPSHPSSPNNFQSSYLNFNPSIAYGRTQPASPSLQLIQPVKNIQFDPHSFYNSAVSAQITPTTTGQQGHSSYSSYNSRNAQRQYQQQGSSATYMRPGGHYSQGYAPQDSLSIERSSASFEMDSSRRPVLQLPARPPSSYSMSSNYQTFDTSPSPVYHQYVGHTANVTGNIYYDQSSENRWSTQ